MNITIAPDIDLQELARCPIVITARVVPGPHGEPVLEACYPSTIRKEPRGKDEYVFKMERDPYGMRAAG